MKAQIKSKRAAFDNGFLKALCSELHEEEDKNNDDEDIDDERLVFVDVDSLPS
jgi:hypothetical protein